MKLSLTFILSLLIVFISSCSTIPEEINTSSKLTQKDDNLFINNHFKNPVNENVVAALTKGYKLKKINALEKELITSSINDGNIKRGYVSSVEEMLNSLEKVLSNELNLEINTSEKNKKIILESLLSDEISFSVSFNENSSNSITSEVLYSKLSYFCQGFIDEQKNILEKSVFEDNFSNRKVVVIYSNKFYEDVNQLKLKYPSQIFIEINDKNFDVAIQKVLEVNRSNERKLLISKLDKNIEIEHNPRIRKDINKVYFLVDYDLGKAVAPSLRNYSIELSIFSSSEIFHGADDLNDLADFEDIFIPVSKKFLKKAGGKNFKSLKDEFERLILDDYITIEKIIRNNLFNMPYLLNTGDIIVMQDRCLKRNMNFWKINLGELSNQP